MEIEYLKQLKKKQKLTNVALSKKSGVPLGTLNKIFSGATKSPQYETIYAIAEALESPMQTTDGKIQNDIVKENSVYKLQNKNYTIDDYLSLPDDMRVELIDGSFYYMGAPSSEHQLILGELYFIITSYIKSKKDMCKVFLSPYNVKLDNDDKTMIQPDLLVVCDNDKVDEKFCNGAPDFIIEIVSKSSTHLDYIKKLNKYLDAGVREYWIVDPIQRKVTVYKFEKDEFPQNYNFTDKIKVGIYDDLVIDLEKVDMHSPEGSLQ